MIKEQVVAETEVKKSRFIATVSPVETEEQAMEFIASLKKKYWDARHNVYAFSLRENGVRRYSDDGEPHGTAGMPVMETIIHSGIENVAVVVTRYFGGILLGTGGLVRAYSDAAKKGLESAQVVTLLPATVFEINCDYSDFDPLQKLSETNGVEILYSEFLASVKMTMAIPDSDFIDFSKKIDDNFSGRLKISVIKNIFMGF